MTIICLGLSGLGLSGLFFYSFFILTFLILTTPIIHFLCSDWVKPYLDLSKFKLIHYFESLFHFFYSSDIWGSTMAYILNLVLSLVGMGFGALVIFLLVTPGLNLILPFHIPLTLKGFDVAWASVGAPGDSAWPSMVFIALQFSIGFIIAGYVLFLLKGIELHWILKTLIYISVLWIWGFLLWATTLGSLHLKTKAGMPLNSQIKVNP